MLAWLDLEMTGLDPEVHTIVEIAVLITDDDLNIIAEGPDIVVSADAAAMAAMDPFVRDMHERSGLLTAIENSSTDLTTAGAETLAFLSEHIPAPRTVPLCGNSIGTDRRFLARHLPEIEEHLHYRSIDVSSIKELARRWYPSVMADAPTKQNEHRALDDIRESVAELVFYRERLFIDQ